MDLWHHLATFWAPLAGSFAVPVCGQNQGGKHFHCLKLKVVPAWVLSTCDSADGGPKGDQQGALNLGPSSCVDCFRLVLLLVAFNLRLLLSRRRVTDLVRR